MSSSSSDKEFAEVWRDACDRYASLTSGDGSNSKLFGKRSAPSEPSAPPSYLESMTSSDDLLSELDRRQSEFKEYREKSATIRRVMEPVCKTVELFSNIAGGAAGNMLPPSAVIFGAITVLMKAAQNISEAYDAVVGLFDSLKAFVTQLSIHAKHKITPELKAIIVRKLSLILITIGRSVKLMQEGRMVYFLKSTVRGEDKALQASIEDLNALSLQEAALVQALSLSIAQDTSETLRSVEKNIQEIKEMMMPGAGGVSDETAKAAATLKRLLSPEMSVKADYDTVSNNVLSGTCEWIFKDPSYEAWEDSNGDFPNANVLWVSGGPGTGKSHLSAKAIAHLERKFRVDSASDGGKKNATDDPPLQKRIAGVGYFFCREDNVATQSFSSIIRTIAYDIGRSIPGYAKYVEQVMRDPDSSSSPHRLWENLIMSFFNDEAISARTRALIIIDGLDEAKKEGSDGVAALLERLNSLDGPAKEKLRFMLVGRPLMDDLIAEKLTKGPTPTIELGESGSNKDVKDFIKHKISQSKTLKKTSKSFKSEISKALADKTFLWVRLVMDEMATRSRESQIRDCLRKFPTDLGATIQHVLDRYSKMASNDDDVQDANSLLAWVSCAERPLTLGEIGAVLALNSEDLEDVIDLERMLRKKYSSLVTLVRNDGLRTADLEALKGMLHVDGFEDGIVDTDGVEVKEDGKETPSDGEKSGGSEDEADDDDEFSDGENDDDDDDEDMAFSSPKDTTTVNISHLSFTEYFRSRKTPLQEDEIGVYVPAAELQLAMACLQLLCDDEKREKFKKHSLFYYACVKFPIHLKNALDHLKATKVNKSISEGDRTAVATYLHKVFTDEAVMEAIGDSSWEMTGDGGLVPLIADESVQAILEWLKDDAVKDCPSPASDWCERVSQGNGKEILEPLARYNVKRWLGVNNAKVHVTTEKIRFMFEFIRKFEKNDIQGPETSKVGFATLAPEHIDIIKEWAQLDDSSPRDLAKLGVTFMYMMSSTNSATWYANINSREDCLPLDKSLSCQEKALSIDPNFPPAILGKAYNLAEPCKKYMEPTAKANLQKSETEDERAGRLKEQDTALGWLEKALEATTGDPVYQFARDHLLSYVASWKARLALTDEERTEAVEYSVRAFNEAQDKAMIAGNILAIIALTSAWTDYLDVMEKLSSIPSKDNPKRNALDDMLAATCENGDYFWNTYSKALANDTTRVDFAVHAFRRVIGFAMVDHRYHILTETRLRLAWVYYYLAGNKIAAVKMLEWVVNFEAHKLRSNPNNFTSDRWNAEYRLHGFYPELAVLAEKNGEDPQPYIDKLQELVNNQAKGDFYGYNDGAIFLSKWYASHGKDDESAKIAKESMKQAIILLTDDVDYNDRAGYTQLALALRNLGDFKNGGAVFCLLHKYRPGDEEMSNDDVEDERGYRGDGDSDDAEDWVDCPGCDRSLRPAIGTWTCKECVELFMLCRRCYKRFKAGEVTIVNCKPEHEYHLISNCGLPKLEEGKIRLVDEGTGKVEIMALPDFLEILKRQWLV